MSGADIHDKYRVDFKGRGTNSWKRIFSHIWKRISPTLIVQYEADAATSPTMPNAWHTQPPVL